MEPKPEGMQRGVHGRCLSQPCTWHKPQRKRDAIVADHKEKMAKKEAAKKEKEQQQQQVGGR